jgi:hypothetical protein
MVLLAWSVYSTAASAAPCDAPSPVKFLRGSSASEIAGGIARGELACFTIAAHRGQHMTISQHASSDSNVVMQIYKPLWTIFHSPDGIRVRGRALRGTAEGEDAKAWAGALPETGRYLLVLGASFGGAEYRVRVEIR